MTLSGAHLAPLKASLRPPLPARSRRTVQPHAVRVGTDLNTRRTAARKVPTSGCTSRTGALRLVCGPSSVSETQPVGASAAAALPEQRLLATAVAAGCYAARVSALARCVVAAAAPSDFPRVRRPALAAAFAPLALLEPGVSSLLGNPTFCAAFLSWVLAQTLKVFTKYVKTKAWDVRVLFDSGGMPSSHTALVVGLSTSVAVQHGLGSSLFVVCLAFSLIVMYDAAGVRRHAGKQAEVLNALVEDYFQGHPVSEQELKEVLGHTPLQVAMGALLGVVVPLVYHAKLAGL